MLFDLNLARITVHSSRDREEQNEECGDREDFATPFESFLQTGDACEFSRARGINTAVRSECCNVGSFCFRQIRNWYDHSSKAFGQDPVRGNPSECSSNASAEAEYGRALSVLPERLEEAACFQ